MSTFPSPLDSIKVASPCSADWNAMIGNERQRYCGQCKLNVYNLSGMTKQDAESLLMNAEGRVCARFFRRADGTVLTRDCPVGWAALKKRMSRVWTAVATVVLTAVSGIGIVNLASSVNEPLMGEIPIERVPQEEEPLMGAVVAEETPEPEMGKMMMGDVDQEYSREQVKKTAR